MLLEENYFMKKIMLLAGLMIISAGCAVQGEKPSAPENAKIRTFFNWSFPSKEADAAKYAEAGVTAAMVLNEKQYKLALKYGIRPYWKCFTPEGPWPQKMTPEEEKYSDYIGGKDLDPKLPRAERRKITDRRRIEKQHRYGGEAVTEPDAQSSAIKCFISDGDFSLSARRLDKILDSAPEGVRGICLDFFGYTNHRGCYCDSCLRKYRAFLKKNKLKDTQANRDCFYRDELVAYYDKVISYIKKRKPEYKVLVHIYPDFRPDHLYGNRIRADYCGQTVAWYFKWPAEKIRRYTKYVVEHAKDHHADAEGIPFLGLNGNAQISLGYKTPADVERELRTILVAGGRSLMICCGHYVIEPGYFEVFKKYCGKPSR